MQNYMLQEQFKAIISIEIFSNVLYIILVDRWICVHAVSKKE